MLPQGRDHLGARGGRSEGARSATEDMIDAALAPVNDATGLGRLGRRGAGAGAKVLEVTRPPSRAVVGGLSGTRLARSSGLFANGAMGPALPLDKRVVVAQPVETVGSEENHTTRILDPLARIVPVLARRVGSRRALVFAGPVSPSERRCPCCLTGRDDGWWDVVPPSTRPLARHYAPRLDVGARGRRR